MRIGMLIPESTSTLCDSRSQSTQRRLVQREHAAARPEATDNPCGAGSGSDSSPRLTLVLGLPFHELTLESALDDCVAAMDDPRPACFVTPNLDFARLAAEQPRLHDIVFHADRILCDGKPLTWLSRLTPTMLPERVAGSDLTPRLLEICVQLRKRVYFFGSDEITLERTAAAYPDLEICGWNSPPFAPIEDWDNPTYVRRIRDAAPDLLLVALGCPKQEYWAVPRLDELGVPLTLCIGASLDFIAGTQTRAPRAIQAVGLEWFWRMMTNPKRLAGRYARDLLFLLRSVPTQWKLRTKQPSAPLQVQHHADGGVTVNCNSTPANILTLVSLAGLAREQRLNDGPIPRLEHVSVALRQCLKKLSLLDQFDTEGSERGKPVIEFPTTNEFRQAASRAA